MASDLTHLLGFWKPPQSLPPSHLHKPISCSGKASTFQGLRWIHGLRLQALAKTMAQRLNRYRPKLFSIFSICVGGREGDFVEVSGSPKDASDQMPIKSPTFDNDKGTPSSGPTCQILPAGNRNVGRSPTLSTTQRHTVGPQHVHPSTVGLSSTCSQTCTVHC